MVVVDIAWTVAGSAGPNAHHLEMAVVSAADPEGNGRCSVKPNAEESCRKPNTTDAKVIASDTTDIWAPYKATGLELKISADVSPDTGYVDASRRPPAEGNGGTRDSPATTPVPDGNASVRDRRRTLSPEPLGRGGLDALGNSGDTSARRPRAFPKTKGTRNGREKEGDDVVDGFLRNHRHQRAESDGPPRHSFGGARGRKTAAAHGRGSGRLSDRLLRRSRTVIYAPDDKGKQEEAVNDEGDRARGRHGGHETQELGPTQKLFGGNEGSGEAGGTWPGRRFSMGEEGQGGGNVGTEEGERTRQGGAGQKELVAPSPLSIQVEDDDDLVDRLFCLGRMAGVRSSGPASCPPRPSGDPGGRGKGRGAFDMDPVQVRCALPVIPLYSGRQNSRLFGVSGKRDTRSADIPHNNVIRSTPNVWLGSISPLLSRQCC